MEEWPHDHVVEFRQERSGWWGFCGDGLVEPCKFGDVNIICIFQKEYGVKRVCGRGWQEVLQRSCVETCVEVSVWECRELQLDDDAEQSHGISQEVQVVPLAHGSVGGYCLCVCGELRESDLFDSREGCGEATCQGLLLDSAEAPERSVVLGEDLLECGDFHARLASNVCLIS